MNGLGGGKVKLTPSILQLRWAKQAVDFDAYADRKNINNDICSGWDYK